MRILYGVCGEGLGHATRSEVVLRHLLARGHVVLVAASGQATPHLARAFANDARARVLPIVGFAIRCADGALNFAGTLQHNAQRLPRMIVENRAAWEEALAFQPDAVVTDFDTFAWLVARSLGRPVLSMHNGHIMTRCLHEPSLLRDHASGVGVTGVLTELLVGECDHYLVTSFFQPPIRPECARTTTLVPPVLRPSALARLTLTARAPEAHVLVYRTASLDDAAVVGALAATPDTRFHVYGVSAGTPLPPNCVRRAPDPERFLDDLAGARAVLGNGGMSLLGEALSLGKPVLVVPVRNQFEQTLNGLYVERLGYGDFREDLTQAALGAFLERAPEHAVRVQARRPHDRNAQLYAALDALLPSSDSQAQRSACAERSDT